MPTENNKVLKLKAQRCKSSQQFKGSYQFHKQMRKIRFTSVPIAISIFQFLHYVFQQLCPIIITIATCVLKHNFKNLLDERFSKLTFKAKLETEDEQKKKQRKEEYNMRKKERERKR